MECIVFYGVEIWGWTEFDEVERLHEKYVKWTLGLDRQNLSYIVREETERVKLRIEAGKRAIKFENSLRTCNNKLLL